MEAEDPGEFDVSVRQEPARVVIEMSGEFDLHGATKMGRRLESIVDAAEAALEVDANEVTFIDSAGLHTLLTMRDRARGRGLTFALSKASVQVASVIEIAGVSDLLTPDR